MLHFCSVDDIGAVFPSASRYAVAVQNARAGVTGEFIRFTRRVLDYMPGMVEYLDAVDTPVYDDMKLWLTKKNIDPASLHVYYSRTRDWTADDIEIASEFITLDPEKGKLWIAGRLYAGTRNIKITYDGGYKPIQINGVDTDTMDCPAVLRQAAVDQAVFNLKRTIGQNQGDASSADGKKGQVTKQPTIDGLLADVAKSLTPYRKPLGGN